MWEAYKNATLTVHIILYALFDLGRCVNDLSILLFPLC